MMRWIKPNEYTPGIILLLRKLIKDMHITNPEVIQFLSDNEITKPETLGKQLTAKTTHANFGDFLTRRNLL
jgi:hypothetical protein